MVIPSPGGRSSRRAISRPRWREVSGSRSLRDARAGAWPRTSFVDNQPVAVKVPRRCRTGARHLREARLRDDPSAAVGPRPGRGRRSAVARRRAGAAVVRDGDDPLRAGRAGLPGRTVPRRERRPRAPPPVGGRARGRPRARPRGDRRHAVDVVVGARRAGHAPRRAGDLGEPRHARQPASARTRARAAVRAAPARRRRAVDRRPAGGGGGADPGGRDARARSLGAHRGAAPRAGDGAGGGGARA